MLLQWVSFGIRIFLPGSVTVDVYVKLYAELFEDSPSRPCGDFHLISVRPWDNSNYRFLRAHSVPKWILNCRKRSLNRKIEDWIHTLEPEGFGFWIFAFAEDGSKVVSIVCKVLFSPPGKNIPCRTSLSNEEYVKGLYSICNERMASYLLTVCRIFPLLSGRISINFVLNNFFLINWSSRLRPIWW